MISKGEYRKSYTLAFQRTHVTKPLKFMMAVLRHLEHGESPYLNEQVVALLLQRGRATLCVCQ